MKTLLRVLVLSSGFIAAAANAQQALQPTMPAAELAQIKTDVKAAMAGYIASFNRKDAKAIAEGSSSSPSVTMGANGVAAETLDQVAARYAGNIANLEKTGWARSEISDPAVCVLSATAALADVQLTRWKTDGSVLSRGATVYILNKAKDGKWRIVTLIGHDAAKSVGCND